MRKLFVFSYASLLLGLFFSVVAASDLTPHQRWARCAQALQGEDLHTLREVFTPDLLNVFVEVPFSTSLPTVRPFGLIHIAALSKNVLSGDAIKFMVEQGFDPNVQCEFAHEESLEQVIGNTYVLRGYEGPIESPLPLDLAVMAGNVKAVKALLESGADPYNTSMHASSTSFLKLILKKCVSKRIGENPLDHAMRYRTLALLGKIQMPATAAEYTEVASLLEEAQFQDDVSSCSIQ